MQRKYIEWFFKNAKQDLKDAFCNFDEMEQIEITEPVKDKLRILFIKHWICIILDKLTYNFFLKYNIIIND